jgi:hypothetical protein
VTTPLLRFDRVSPSGAARQHRTSQKATPSRNPAHDRANRYAHNLCYLLILEAINVVELDHHREIVRQLP